MSKQRAEKRRKVVYKDDPEEKVAELEDFLFGNKGDAKEVFSRRVEADSDDDLTLTDLLAPGGQLFFEDKGDPSLKHSYQFSSSSDEEDSEGPASDSEDEQEGQATSGSAEEAAAVDEDDRQEGVQGAGSDAEEEACPSNDPAAAAAVGGGTRRRQPVWSDPADQELKVDISSKARLRKLRASHAETVVDGSAYEAALRRQHAALHPRTSWASLNKKTDKKRHKDSDSEEDDADMAAVLAGAGGVLAARSARLQPGSIETSRLKDANVADPSKAVVQSVGWHPSGQLMLTAGLDKRLRLFKVDGGDNPLVQAVFLRECPVHQAAWASGGAQVIASGRRPFFFLYDLASSQVERIQPSNGTSPPLKSLESFATTLPGSTGPGGHMVAFYGDQGYVPLVSLSSRQWVASLKMSGSVRCAAWAPGGEQLITLGGDGVVYTWEMRMRRCLSQFRDYANIRPTALAVSPDGRYLATGSESGALNLYPGPLAGSREVLGSGLEVEDGGRGAAYRPPSALQLLGSSVSNGKPIKEVLNLTTTVDSIVFSHDSQMVAFASRMKKDAMRLLHLPSCTVFSNWPTSRSPLHYVHSLAFSPHSGFLTIGNARGRALLYRLHYYQEA